MFKHRGILAIFLCLLLCFSNTAHGAEGGTMLFETDSEFSGFIKFAVSIDDTLYICSGDLLAYKLGDTEPTKIMDFLPLVLTENDTYNSDDGSMGIAADMLDWRDRLTCPFEYNGKLHMIHELTGSIMALEEGEFVNTGMMISLPDIPDEDHALSNRFVSIFEFENKVYILARKELYDFEAPMELWIVDTTTGEHKTIATEFPLTGVCSYKPGQLLGWTPPVLGGEKEESYPRLFVLDADTGKTLEDPVVADKSNWQSPTCPFYDEKTGSIYYVLQNRLLRKNSINTGPDVMAYFEHDLYQGRSPISMISGTHLIILSSYGDVYIRNIQAEPMTEALRITGNFISGSVSGFMSENPDIPIEIVDIGHYPISADEVVQRISSGEDSIDIFVVDYASGAQQLIRKGYAVDLSGNEAITRAFDRMYAPIREAIMVDGKPMGFPAAVSESLWTYNKELFVELNLKYPETFFDFIDLFQRWKNEYKDEHPSIWLTPDYGYLNDNFEQYLMDNYNVVEQYIMEFSKPDEPLKFNTPEFLEIMRKLEEMPENAIEGQNISTYDESSTVLLDSFFDVYSSITLRKGMFPTLAPRVSQDSEPVIGIHLSLFIINPNSSNMKNAMHFIEYMADHSEYQTMLAMYPDFNEPLPWPGAVFELEDAQASLAEILVMEVTEENRLEVEEMIENAELNIEQVKSRYWIFSPDSINEYRALMNNSRLVVDSMRTDIIDAVYDLIYRYLQKQITLEKMVKEIDQKMQMMYLETR